MPRLTTDQYHAILARQRAASTVGGAQATATEPDAGPEADLQEAIEAECRRRGWYVVRSRMDRATTCGVGTPDLIIAADGGRTIWIECKRGKAKLRHEQLAAKFQLESLGHRHYVVMSLAEFLGIIAKEIRK